MKFNILICDNDYRYMEPLTSGKYPESMRSLVGKRLPEFTKEEAKLVAGSMDFLGLNYYTSNYAANKPRVEPSPISKAKLSYVTDPNVNYLSEETFLYQLFKLFMLNLLIYHILLLFSLAR